jgi:hypothetical protein
MQQYHFIDSYLAEKIIMKTSQTIEVEEDMAYTGMFNIKKIEGIKIGTVYWIDRPDLRWGPDQKMATSDPTRQPMICIGVGTKFTLIEKDKMPELVQKLRDADEDVELGSIKLPREALKEVSDELQARSKQHF